MLKDKTVDYNMPQFLKSSLWLLNVARNAVVVIFGTLLAYVLYLNGFTPFQLTGQPINLDI